MNRPTGNDIRFRENNTDQIFLKTGGYFGINGDPETYRLSVNGTSKFTSAMTFENTSNGQINFYNNSSTRYFRIGSNTVSSNYFTFQASTANGGTSFNTTPALSISAVNNAVAINTTAISGTDPTNGTNRNYKFNVQGDMNINGQLFQNNAEFVTSRWTKSTNESGNNIYRNSKVGIGNVPAPAYTLDVGGDINLIGILHINGNKQWLDSNGIIKIVNSADIAENVTIPSGLSTYSNGPIVIANGFTVDVSSGGTWSII